MDNELIERIKEIAYRDSAKSVTVRADDLRELLNLIAQPAAPVTTQEPVAWLVVSPDELEPVKGVAHSQEFADKYRSTGWSVTPLYTHSDAAEVGRLRFALEHYCKLLNEAVAERETTLNKLAERDALLTAISSWTTETRDAVLESFQEELNESCSYEWYDNAIADLMKLVTALSASAEPNFVKEKS